MEAIAGDLFIGAGFNSDDQWRSLDAAERQARKALELDGQQAQAHLTLAYVRWTQRDWSAAVNDFDRAYALNPNDYAVVNSASWNSLYRGHGELAMQQMERSVALNPGDFANQNNAASLLYCAERWEDSRRQAGLVTQLAPDAAYGYASLAAANARLGDAAGVRSSAAMAEARKPSLSDLGKMARAYSLVGDVAEARRLFEAAIAGYGSLAHNYEWHYDMHAAMGDVEAAVAYLDRVISEGFGLCSSVLLHFRPGHPSFDPIRSHPRFSELVERTGEPVRRPVRHQRAQ